MKMASAVDSINCRSVQKIVTNYGCTDAAQVTAKKFLPRMNTDHTDNKDQIPNKSVVGFGFSRSLRERITYR